MDRDQPHAGCGIGSRQLQTGGFSDSEANGGAPHNFESSAFLVCTVFPQTYFVRQYLTNFGLGFGCFFFQRRKRSALKRNVFLVRPSIGEALANDALGQLIGAAGIVNA
jgi:hypothetical protein